MGLINELSNISGYMAIIIKKSIDVFVPATNK